MVGGEAQGPGTLNMANDLPPHIPVMLREVMQSLQPEDGDDIIDGTFGAGGYSRAFLDKGARIIALDRDPDALLVAKKFDQQFGDKFEFVNDEFGQMDSVCQQLGVSSVDGVVLDIGVSSMQIDKAHRGFSFQHDGPLDMRMGQVGPSAADLINTADGKDLTRIIGILGEEKHAGRVSRAIVEERTKAPIMRTLDLANLVEKTLGRKFSDRIHPATRTFQALRIYINKELGQLAKALFAAERILKYGGRLVVVTFHSLEDRIVKQFFTDRCGAIAGSRHLPQVEEYPPSFLQVKRSAIKARDDETAINPRSRSAKLRWAVRTDAVSRDEDMSIFGREMALQ